MRLDDLPDTAGERRGDAIAFLPWGLLAALLVFGGLALSARAGDSYMTVAGLLFAGFGLLLGFRVLNRVLP